MSRAALVEALAERLLRTSGAWPKRLFGEVSERARQLQRAEELGFDTSQVYYHGTKADIDAFRPSRGATDSFVGLTDDTIRHRRGSYGPGVYVSKTPQRTDGFAGVYDDAPSGGNIIPVFARRGKFIPTIGQDGRIKDPRDIRSIFAAFDPARAGEADLLAGLAIGVPVTALTLREALLQRAQENA